MEQPRARDAIYQNLIDADCDRETIDRFFELGDEGRLKEQLSLLGSHRQVLLQTVRACQKKLDCLDYLTYGMKKEAAARDTKTQSKRRNDL